MKELVFNEENKPDYSFILNLKLDILSFISLQDKIKQGFETTYGQFNFRTELKKELPSMIGSLCIGFVVLCLTLPAFFYSVEPQFALSYFVDVIYYLYFPIFLFGFLILFLIPSLIKIKNPQKLYKISFSYEQWQWLQFLEKCYVVMEKNGWNWSHFSMVIKDPNKIQSLFEKRDSKNFDLLFEIAFGKDLHAIDEEISDSERNKLLQDQILNHISILMEFVDDETEDDKPIISQVIGNWQKRLAEYSYRDKLLFDEHLTEIINNKMQNPSYPLNLNNWKTLNM